MMDARTGIQYSIFPQDFRPIKLSLWADGWHQVRAKKSRSGEQPEESFVAARDGGLQRTNAVGQLKGFFCNHIVSKYDLHIFILACNIYRVSYCDHIFDHISLLQSENIKNMGLPMFSTKICAKHTIIDVYNRNNNIFSTIEQVVANVILIATEYYSCYYDKKKERKNLSFLVMHTTGIAERVIMFMCSRS